MLKKEEKPRRRGLMIKSLPRDGVLFMAGARPRDRILSVNGHAVADELDFYYHAARDYMEIEIERGGRVGVIDAERDGGVPLDIEFIENPVNRCANRCVFCFIDQMPKGLRRGLYIKDEDVKHSFLNGNYVTMTNMRQGDMERIAAIGLSPIFVSVHATDPEVRAKMLGRKRLPDIREQLGFLSDNGIAFHTQIVVCPGMNDGRVLERTVRDLFKYGRSLLSIAVVPVGLTKFRDGLPKLMPVDKSLAVDICGKMDSISSRMKEKDGVRKLFLADEFFIKAGLPIPKAGYYEDYPQIENGVGLVRQLVEAGAVALRKSRSNYKGGSLPLSGNQPKSGCFPLPPHAGLCPATPRHDLYFNPAGGCALHTRYSLRLSSISPRPRFPRGSAPRGTASVLVITGVSVCPYLKKILGGIDKRYDVIAVENHYMGETVTVAGLLTARDVIRKIKESSSKKSYDMVILPRVMFNYKGYTLDGYSALRIEKIVGLPVRVVGSIAEMF